MSNCRLESINNFIKNHIILIKGDCCIYAFVNALFMVKMINLEILCELLFCDITSFGKQICPCSRAIKSILSSKSAHTLSRYMAKYGHPNIHIYNISVIFKSLLFFFFIYTQLIANWLMVSSP